MMENWYPTFCTIIESRVEENCEGYSNGVCLESVSNDGPTEVGDSSCANNWPLCFGTFEWYAMMVEMKIRKTSLLSVYLYLLNEVDVIIRLIIALCVCVSGVSCTNTKSHMKTLSLATHVLSLLIQRLRSRGSKKKCYSSISEGFPLSSLIRYN